MKKIFTLLVSLFSLLSVQAQSYQGNQGSLSVTTVTDRPIKVLINGRNMSGWHDNDNEVYVSDLRPGYYTVKVFQQRNRRSWSGSSNSNQMVQVYDTRLYLRPRTHVDIIINRFGRAFVDERTLGSGWGQWDTEWNNDNGNHNNPWNGQSFPRQTMETTSFNSFLQMLRSESFDNTRQTLAKQTIRENYFTASQIKDIVEIFSYENSKLDIAKFAYDRCVDKNNYFIINQALTYSSSKEELARYMQANND